jgi:hypothetical protein
MTPPFSNESRYEIKQRSEGRSELDGLEYAPELLKCGHLNHDKKSPEYNDPENGIRVTIWQEVAYHMIHQPRPKDIGLSNENNSRAIKCNTQELIDMGYSYDEVRELVGKAINQWEDWKKDRFIKSYVWKDGSYMPPEVEFENVEGEYNTDMTSQEFVKEMENVLTECFTDCLDIVQKKNADYAGDENPFKNFEMAEKNLNVQTEKGILVRISDKLSRVANLIDKDAQVKDEAVEDTIKDAINYFAILYCYRKGRYERQRKNNLPTE